MSTRRGFLALLGLAGPAAVLAPKAMLDSGKATDFPIGEVTPPTFIGNMVQNVELTPMRYLGLAQLKNEGDPCSFDPEPEDEA
jgi:hypothetical protein